MNDIFTILIFLGLITVTLIFTLKGLKQLLFICKVMTSGRTRIKGKIVDHKARRHSARKLRMYHAIYRWKDPGNYTHESELGFFPRKGRAGDMVELLVDRKSGLVDSIPDLKYRGIRGTMLFISGLAIGTFAVWRFGIIAFDIIMQVVKR